MLTASWLPLACTASASPARASRPTRAAGILEFHKHKGLPYAPAVDGFVFSKDEIENYAQRLIRQNDARSIEHVRFLMTPQAARPGAPQVNRCHHQEQSLSLSLLSPKRYSIRRAFEPAHRLYTESAL